MKPISPCRDFCRNSAALRRGLSERSELLGFLWTRKDHHGRDALYIQSRLIFPSWSSQRRFSSRSFISLPRFLADLAMSEKPQSVIDNPALKVFVSVAESRLSIKHLI